MIISPQQARSGWTDWHVLGTVMMIAIGSAVTIDAWTSIGHIAIYRNHTRHLFLLPLVILWLIWVRRERFKLCEPVGTWVGPLIVGVGWLMSALGDRSQIEVVWHLGAVGVVIGCIVSVMGVQVLKAYSPAFVALAFILPIPGRVADLMTQALSDFTATLIQPALGVSVIAVQVHEAVAGLLCAFLLAYAFAFAMPYRIWVRSLLLAISPLAAALMLMVQMALYRVFLTSWHTDQAEIWVDWAGWLMVPLTLAMLAGMIRLLRWAAVPLQYYKLADET